MANPKKVRYTRASPSVCMGHGKLFMMGSVYYITVNEKQRIHNDIYAPISFKLNGF